MKKPSAISGQQKRTKGKSMTKSIEYTERGILLPPEIDDVTRREFLIGSAGLLLLPAACGGNGEGEESASGETKVIENMLGETEVPARPERVVVIEGFTGLDTAVIVEAPIVGVSYNPMIEGGFPEYLEGNGLSELPDIGWVDVNLERIAELSPDLILSAEFLEDGVQENLSSIAPTVVFENIAFIWQSPTDWQTMVLQFADALGDVPAAERAIANFDERLEGVRRDHGDRLENLTVSVVRINPGSFQLFPGQGPGSAILEQLGVERPEGQRPGDEPPENFSLENIPELDADVILVFGLDEGDENRPYFEREILSNPLWQSLEAVRAGRVHVVDSAPWNHAGSVQSAHEILDDIEEYLLDGQ